MKEHYGSNSSDKMRSSFGIDLGSDEEERKDT